MKHAFRNALIRIVTMLGLEFGILLSGVVVTETVFSWQCVGRLVTTAITQRDIPVVQAAVVIGDLMGISLGIIAGYRGGRLDDIIMRLADIQLAFPFILLAIMVLVVLGPGVWNLIPVLGIGQWVTYARIARG